MYKNQKFLFKKKRIRNDTQKSHKMLNRCGYAEQRLYLRTTGTLFLFRQQPEHSCANKIVESAHLMDGVTIAGPIFQPSKTCSASTTEKRGQSDGLCSTDTDTCIGIGRIQIRGYGNFLKNPTRGYVLLFFK